MPNVLRRPEVERATGLKRSTIYELMAKGEFPKPIRLTGKAVGWLSDEVSEFVDIRTAQRDAAVIPPDKAPRRAEARGA